MSSLIGHPARGWIKNVTICASGLDGGFQVHSNRRLKRQRQSDPRSHPWAAELCNPLACRSFRPHLSLRRQSLQNKFAVGRLVLSAARRRRTQHQRPRKTCDVLQRRHSREAQSTRDSSRKCAPLEFPTGVSADPRGMKRRDRARLGRIRGTSPWPTQPSFL
jgi:hypothetical protein